ncbi:MAG: HAD-IIIC family phosphatase [Bacteroidetes bacterium]|nr:HAD-IIIC family phosphatase [Bacteroidota bacterium]
MEANSLYNLTSLSYPEILKANGKFDQTSMDADFKIHLLTNLTINPIKEILEFALKSINLNPTITIGNYDNVVQDSFNVLKHDMVIIFYDMINFTNDFFIKCELMEEGEVNETIEKHKNEIRLLFSNLADQSLVLLNKFSSYGFDELIHTKSNVQIVEGELNSFIQENKPQNFELIDTKGLVASLGIGNALDKQKFNRYKALYKIDFFKKYFSSIHNILLKRTGRLKKALIMDCDNTLWKGVIGEDGLEGIDISPKSEIGIYYNIIQNIIVSLSKKGVLICLCSKNNHRDVEGVFRNKRDMVLSEDNIVAKKINWNNKSDNLKVLADELNIGLDSFVFVDDSEFEIGLINSSLPEVLTVLVPKDIELYPSLMIEIARRYFNLQPLGEDLKKVMGYKDQVRRSKLRESMGNIDSYLSTLETTITIYKDNDDHVARIAQLSEKTNQFNLTTYRYTQNDILQFINNPVMSVFSVDVSDRFGNSGITGVCILKELKEDDKTVEIDSLLLSCRILGRRVEDSFLDFLLMHSKENGYQTITSKYKKTKKNAQVKDFFHSHGFAIAQKTDNETSYKLKLLDYSANSPEFIKKNINI